MESRINLFTMFIFMWLVGLISISLAQPISIASNQSTSDVNAVNAPSFPYIAQITADNVNIRSGPGTNYYRCGQLNKGDRIKVVGSQRGWSRIVPPAGSFSWISTQYVSIDPNDPSVGVVTADGVRIYAGSDYIEPIYSTTVQLRLNRGDKVGLIGEQKSGYYKITPPTGAYLWVSSRYIEPLGPVGQVPLTAQPTPPKPEHPAMVPTKISIESQKLKEYYALEKQIKAERAKPIPQQDYTKIKKALSEIANNKDAGKAARYCQFALKQIERFELALEAEKQIRLQDARLAQIRQQIDKARSARLAKVKDLGRFAVIGRFQRSVIYDQQIEPAHYRIVDDSGKTICYVLPTGPALQVDLNKFVGRKVGLVGSIQPHLPTAGTLVQFTEIVALD